METIAPQGKGLAKSLTTIQSPEQKTKYIIAGIVCSTFGFFIASLPLGTATLVVGRILLKNHIKVCGYAFCFIGTAWAIGLPLLHFLALFKTTTISILPVIPKF